MTLGQLIMLAIGLVTLVVGIIILLTSSRGTERQRCLPRWFT